MRFAKAPVLGAIGLLSLLLVTAVFFWFARPRTEKEHLSSSMAPQVVIDESKAKLFSDSVIDDLLSDRQGALFSKMETSLRENHNPESFSIFLDQLFAAYGKPVSVEYKKNSVGKKVDNLIRERPMRKFWYAVETTEMKMGSHFIFVEIIEEEGRLASSGFAIVHFPLGVPDDMK